jgi:hypothetical protein
MRATLEIPDAVLRRAKSAAAARGISLRELVIEALNEKLAGQPAIGDKPWMASFGKLKHLRKETKRINSIIETEFERIETQEER